MALESIITLSLAMGIFLSGEKVFSLWSCHQNSLSNFWNQTTHQLWSDTSPPHFSSFSLDRCSKVTKQTLGTNASWTWANRNMQWHFQSMAVTKGQQ